MTKKEKEVHAQLIVRVDGLKERLERVHDQMAKHELAIQELGGRLERMERVICGMMGQGVYKSDLEVMKKWMGNRWVPVSKGFGLAKKKDAEGLTRRLKRKGGN